MEIFKRVRCVDCGEVYPDVGFPYCCPVCGGIFDFVDFAPWKAEWKDPGQLGIWKWKRSIGIDAESELISLGEGNTPLVKADAWGHEVFFKCEYLNPTGSFKDRGSAIIATCMKTRGVRQAVEDSSGNAGASWAAYAARAGINTTILIPTDASGPKRRQIEAYGATLVRVPGSRSDVSRAAIQAVRGTTAYASHAWLPFNIRGYSTAAYEIYEQLGNSLPGTIIVPAGQGGLLLGLWHGFDSMRIANNTLHIPQIIGVQARACAPLFDMYSNIMHSNSMGLTIAEGVNVSEPLRKKALMDAVRISKGEFLCVEEECILLGRDSLAHKGFIVEPTSAIAYCALENIIENTPKPVVVMLTGSGFKATAYL